MASPRKYGFVDAGRTVSLVRPVVTVISAAALLSAMAVTAPQPGSPALTGVVYPRISFSRDQRLVTIRYEAGEWRFVRPVISSWSYKAAGAVYWIAPCGDDTSRGSRAHPFKTLTKGMTVADPGDIVYVRAGTYVESLSISRSGEEGKPIILSCAPGALGRVKITPPRDYVVQNPGGAVITLRGCRHVWINGLVIEGPRGRPEAPKQEKYGANGITWSGGAGFGCRAMNNVVYGNVHCGLKEMGHGGTGIRMEGNVIFENGTTSTDHGIYCPADELMIDGNIIFNNAGFGIHSYEKPRRQSITRNICLGNREGGIILAGSANRVSHNVCVGNQFGIFYYRSNCTDNIVENNIFAFNHVDCGYDNGGGKLGDPARNTDDSNCYFPGQPDARIGPGGHEVLADPRFVDAATGDFRLRADSPCRDRASRDVTPFPAGMPDLGAFSRTVDSPVRERRRERPLP